MDAQHKRITEHKFRHVAIGFAESVDFMLETDKNEQHKADVQMMSGTFLGYIWKTKENIVGTQDAVYKSRTIRRRQMISPTTQRAWTPSR